MPDPTNLLYYLINIKKHKCSVFKSNARRDFGEYNSVIKVVLNEGKQTKKSEWNIKILKRREE